MPTRSLRLSSPLDLRRTLAPVGRGGSDPSFRWAQGHCWRATRTVDGAATVRMRLVANRVEAEAWGPGAERALDSLPRLLGSEDRPGDFRPSHPLVARLHHRFRGVRIGRTDAVMEALVPSILEQKVTGLEARRAQRRLVLTYGRPAPGPPGLHLPPDPHVLARVPYYDMHVLGVERKRADAVRRACAQAHRVERLVDLPAEEARRRLMTLPGVGLAFYSLAAQHESDRAHECICASARGFCCGSHRFWVVANSSFVAPCQASTIMRCRPASASVAHESWVTARVSCSQSERAPMPAPGSRFSACAGDACLGRAGACAAGASCRWAWV